MDAGSLPGDQDVFNGDGNGLAALAHASGQMHEVNGVNGWQDGSIPTSGPVSAISAVWSPAGYRYVYAVENGVLHEINSVNGWQDGSIPTTAPDSAVSATWSHIGYRYVYTVE